jgi:hypothetical protein
VPQIVVAVVVAIGLMGLVPKGADAHPVSHPGGLASAVLVSHDPTQPVSGPGGRLVTWTSVNVRLVKPDPDRKTSWFYVFAPRDRIGSAAAPKRLPVVFFIHGLTADDPAHAYTDWLDHLTREGNVVVYPVYETCSTCYGAWRGDLAGDLAAAWRWLRIGGHEPFMPLRPLGPIVIGHSLGAAMALDYKDLSATHSGLPSPSAVFAVDPAHLDRTVDERLDESGVRLDCLVSDEDHLAGSGGCDEAWKDARLTDNTSSRYNYLELRTDRSERRALVADHGAPDDACHAGRCIAPDALDWYGFWKIADGLRDCVVVHDYCRYAQGSEGGSPAETFMGRWTDTGRPVKPILVSLTGHP